MKCYFNNKDCLHRIDGPAVEYASGTKQYYVNRLRHRINGPAFESYDGLKEYYLNHQLHKIDGPAIEFSDGTKYWYISGMCISRVIFIFKLYTLNNINVL